jgi:hypothetical protein
MAAGKYDFTIEQGSSFKLSLIYKDQNENPVNLTDWCARLTWKTNTNLTQVFLSSNIDYSVYKFSIDPIAGKLTLMIPANTTNAFNFSNCKYDLELQSPDDIYDGGGKYTTRLLFGMINIVKRFSQSGQILDCST